MFPASSASRRGRWTSSGAVFDPEDDYLNEGPNFASWQRGGSLSSAESRVRRSPQAGSEGNSDHRPSAAGAGDYGAPSVIAPARLD